MKNTILILAAAATSAVSLHGQIPTGTKLIANVPFAFHQGAGMMPAGRYEFKMAQGSVVRLDNPEAGVGAVSVVGTRVASPSKKGQLRFQCYGASNQCFLREIAAPGSSMAMYLPQSKVEKEYGSSGSARVAVIDAAQASASGE